MAAALREALIKLLAAHRQGTRLALLFDYDGTLTPIVEHPAQARPEPTTLGLLQRLARQPGIHVGIISGRCLDDLRGIVSLPGLYYAGTCGLELDLLGERVAHPEADLYRRLVEGVVHRFGTLTTDYPGAWVENKRLGLTLHYRKVALRHHKELLIRAEQVVRRYANCLRVVEGPMAWEITPALSWDKGSALRQILDSIGSPALPVYAGDGANDTEAVMTAVELGGVALGIGTSAPPGVQYRLHDPAALMSFLTCLAESVEGSSAVSVA